LIRPGSQRGGMDAQYIGCFAQAEPIEVSGQFRLLTFQAGVETVPIEIEPIPVIPE
jgi:hypothetical protein